MKPNSNTLHDRINNIALALVLLLLTVFYLGGLSSVPFHPDESTYIFMSNDLEILLNNPQSLFWQPNQEDSLREHYRILDPPTSRNMIAIGRALALQPSLSADWDWSQTWQQNQQAGAFPDASLLLSSRMAIAIFLPFSLLFLYLSTKEISERLTAWIAMLLMAGNALILLHTRRAMSESFLLFTITLALFFLIHYQKKPWLSAIPIGLALNAKLSAAPFVAVGLLVILLITIKEKWSIRKFMGQVAAFGLAIVLITFILNPFLWAHPISAAQASWEARLALTDRQVATVASVSPEQVLDNFPKRLGNLIAHLFYTPPAIADVANYLAETAESAEAYLAKPIHSLGRNLIAGSAVLILSLAGFLFSLIDLVRSKTLPLLILFLSGLAQIAALLLLVPLPFQRYVLPAVPFACFWTAYGLSKFINGFLSSFKKKQGSKP